MPRVSRDTLPLVAVALTICATGGCGYMVGSPYSPQVRSVAVPIFTNQTFRRDLEFQLTEAVQREIKTRTPYRLAREGTSDTVLRGNIVSVRKDVLGESAFDDPRELQLSLAVEVTWEDVRTGRILGQRRVAIDAAAVQFLSTADFAPEVGQSLATGTQELVNKTARQIVNTMEAPW